MNKLQVLEANIYDLVSIILRKFPCDFICDGNGAVIMGFFFSASGLSVDKRWELLTHFVCLVCLVFDLFMQISAIFPEILFPNAPIPFFF